jgi:putative two-component system response regulator
MPQVDQLKPMSLFCHPVSHASDIGGMDNHEKQAEIGAKILAEGSSPYMRMGALIALTHHECWGGSGYPSGIMGDEIPLAGRVMLFCGQYDALRSQRPYKPSVDHRTTVKILVEGDGRTRLEQFCPQVLDAFVSRDDDFERISAVGGSTRRTN